jgi:ArsR family transcriptional regulator, repressor of sdpIR and other operons
MNKVFKALSDPTRRKVLALLRERPMTAGELAEHFEVSKPTMSAHFAVLREAGLVEPVKQGRVITYHLMMSVLEEAMFGFAQVFGLEVKATDQTTVSPDPISHKSNSHQQETQS